MVLITGVATLFLCLTIVLLFGTVIQRYKTLQSVPGRVEEIRRLRQEGLAIHHEEDH